MTCCSHCADAESLFSRRTARRELRRYRRRGPSATTRHLLRMLASEGVQNATLLDIGGGVGAIQHELLASGAERAVHVDASHAYLRASEEEAARQGHQERLSHQYGDFVELSDSLDAADIVTLDRVVCCYPDMPRLVAASAAKARRLYGLSFPRDHWPALAAVLAGNLFFKLRRSSFRTFVHPPRAIREQISRHGLSLVGETRTPIWQVEVYRRD